VSICGISDRPLPRLRLISGTGQADQRREHAMTPTTADALLMQARALLPGRPSPAQALAAQVNGALLIDIRGDDQRRAG
jgi:hypothetical protein